jgi:hypothetical protein
MKLIIKHSDYVGASASGLCLMHCIATPILFLSQASLISISNEMLFLWQSLNFLFLAISFIAIYYSVQNSSNSYVKILFFLNWLILSALILIELFEILSIAEFYTYIAATSLSILHIYNLNYCRCEDDSCCVD